MLRNIIIILLNPFFLFSYLLLKLFRIKIGYINISRFGEAVYEYFLLKNFIDKKKSIIFYQIPISSQFLLKIIEKEKKIFKLNVIVREFINYLISNKSNDVLTINHIASRDIYYNDIYKFPIIYNFSKSEIDDVNNFFIKNNLNIAKEFICIHNRDNDYLEKLDRRINFSYHNYRNFSINDFNKSFTSLTKLFLVLRTGIISNERINYQSDKILDLPFIRHSSLISFYILANCKYYIGSDSGAWTIAYLFKKPIFFINFSLTIAHQQLINCVNTCMIFKKIYCKTKKRYLSLKEIIKLDLIGISNNKDIDKKKLEFHDNTENEIFDYIEEIKYTDKKIIFINNEHKVLCNIFWNILIKNLKLDLKKKIYPIIGYKFLKDNQYLLN